jgi:hypothetical protein
MIPKGEYPNMEIRSVFAEPAAHYAERCSVVKRSAYCQIKTLHSVIKTIYRAERSPARSEVRRLLCRHQKTMYGIF